MISLTNEIDADATVHLLHGCHNRFLLIEEHARQYQYIDRPSFVRTLVASAAQYRFKVDSVLFVTPSTIGDIAFRVYDSDGSEERMCGNGLRCVVAHFLSTMAKERVQVETQDGIKEGFWLNGYSAISMSRPRQFQKLENFFFVDTGCPHLVVWDPNGDFDAYPMLEAEGRALCHHAQLCHQLGIDPREGVYVNFVSRSGEQIQIRTYERHIEAITEACGTGNCAAALVLNQFGGHRFPITLMNRGGILNVDSLGNEIVLSGPTAALFSMTVRELLAA
jgi:diaminopimelate epimerase